ncbi:MAG: thioredoxin [candidate division WOR-3 bacterium]
MKDIDGKNFYDEIKEGVVVLDIWADWCRPCKAIEPYLKELEREYPSVKFVKLNADDYPEILQDLGVISIPTVIYFKDGKEMARIIGAHPKHKFKETLEGVL